MPRRSVRAAPKTGYYVLTALGTLASQYYFNYLFFFLRDRFGFDDRGNLWTSALHGAIYTVSAVWCGRFAERRGYHTSLLVGFGGLFLCLMAGLFAATPALVLGVLAIYSVVLLFIWPAMEALVIEHEPPARVPHMVGIYNCTWSASAALAYFTGGPLYDWLGVGAVFVVPAVIFLAEFVITLRLRRMARAFSLNAEPQETTDVTAVSATSGVDQSVRPETFLRLAWLANPLSYVAIYTLLAVMPGLAERFELSATEVGVFCSIWFFGRLAAFVVLWQWTGWHYRFRWLWGGYVTLVCGFAAILLAPSFWMVVIAQVAFGLATGVIYYSSLFYSMDVGEAKAEHGGLHEAMIGVGICLGPAVGATSLQFFPEVPRAGVFAVSGVLVLGLCALTVVWARARLARV